MLTRPIWAGLLRALSMVPLGAIYQRVHALSALLGAAAVVMVVWLGRRWFPKWVGMGTAGSGNEREAVAGALIAGTVLALQGPFWISATRASPEMLSLVLVLGVMVLTELAVTRRRLGWGIAAGALAGVAVVESPVGALHVPVVLLQAAGALADDLTAPVKPDRRRPVVAVAGAFLAGAVVPLAAVTTVLAASPLRDALGLRTVGALLRALVRAHAAQVRESLPPLGWLLTALVTVVPVGVVLWAVSSPVRRRRVRMSVAAGILTCWGLAVLLHTPLAPWPTLPSPLPSPFPSLWVAVWLGAGVAMGARVLRDTLLAKLAPRVAMAGGLVLALAGAVRAFPYVDDRALRAAGWVGEGIARELAPAAWVVSGGGWDGVVMAVARQRQAAPRWVRLDLARESEYLARLSAYPWGTPLAKAMLPVGLEAWLPLWFEVVPTARTNAVTFDLPHFFEATVGAAVPGLWIYRSVAGAPPPVGEIERWRRDAERYRALWQRGLGPYRGVGGMALREASRTMNDLAVRLEEMERPDVAMRAYHAALAADPDNIVAALNRARLARRMERLEADRTEQELMRLVETYAGRLDLLRVRVQFGRIRDPAWLFERSRQLARVGRLDEAITELGQAMIIGGTNDLAVAAVARLLAAKGRWEEARAALDEGERRFPNSRSIATTREWLVDLQEGAESERGGPDDLARAAMHVLRGEWTAAESALRSHLERTPDDPAVAALGGLVALNRGDLHSARTLSERAVRRDRPRPPLAYLTLAATAMAENRWLDARRTLEQALGEYPNLLAARRLLTVWAHQQRDSAALNTHLVGWLRQSPKEPTALQLLADRYAELRQFDRAEAVLRFLAERYPSATHFNGLAWTLWRQGRADEALPAAEEAVRRAPTYADAWANLAAIRWDLGRRDEAMAALAEAERLSPTSETVRARAALLRGAN
ncbi:MAG: tetratricopeptide repeat protein [Kiritimatiellae bacterium]|nr:tetratricopeptide repeat protein [Kiritimatiellia bacterium]